MDQTRFVQTNFTAGELSPRLKGRTDLKKYLNGAQTLLNVVTAPQGYAERRSGTYYVTGTKNNGQVRLIEFQYSNTQTYVMEFGVDGGSLYIRIFRDSGQLIDSTEVPDDEPTEITDSYSITAAELKEMHFQQSADVLYITHEDHPPYTLSRGSGSDSDADTWTFEELDVWGGPFLPQNTEDTYLDWNTTGSDDGEVFIDAYSSGEFDDDGEFINGVAYSNFWSDDDAGRWVLVHGRDGDDSEGPLKARMATVIEIQDLNGTNDRARCRIKRRQYDVGDKPTPYWRLGAWSDSVGPVDCTFHQGRLWFGGSAFEPQGVFGSRTNDYLHYQPFDVDDLSVLADHGVTAIIDDDKVNTVRWLLSDKDGLIIATDGGFFLLTGQDGGTVDAEKLIEIRRHNTYGVDANVRPHRIGGALLFVQSDGRTVREFSYRFDVDRWMAPDATILAEHISLGGLSDSAYQEEPFSRVWYVRDDGQLAVLTYERHEDVIGWSRMTIGGSFSTGDAIVESVAIIREGGVDQIWLAVKRSIDVDGDDTAETVRYIEYINTRFDDDVSIEDAFFVDCGLSEEFDPAESSVSGLDHLIGETVQILGDGVVLTEQVVDENGAVDLVDLEGESTSASDVHAGLGFTSTIETMPLLPQMHVDPRARMARCHKVHMYLHRSATGNVNDDAIEEYETGSVYTGLAEVSVNSAFNRLVEIEIEATDPLPLTVLGCVFEMSAGE